MVAVAKDAEATAAAAEVSVDEPMVAEAIDIPGLMVELQLQDKNGHGDKYELVSVLGNMPVGVIHSLGQGLKATCRRHMRCVCWVSIGAGRRLSLLRAEMKWLAEAPGKSEADHWASCIQLKKPGGAKIRAT